MPPEILRRLAKAGANRVHFGFMMRLMLRQAMVILLTLGPAQAELRELLCPGLDTRLPLWVPEPDASTGGKKKPAIVYYHGTNGQPALGFVRRAAKDLPFVVVGMTYAQRGRLQYSEEGIASELAQLTQLKQILIDDIGVDPSRIYVAGFSKGGWFTALLLERDRSLAGGLVLGAGVFQPRQGPEPRPFARPTPVYIGVGRLDGNYPQSLAALVHFRKLGAAVDFEAWSGVGHAQPGEIPPGMTQWLRLRVANEGGDGPLPGDAGAWIDRRLAEIELMEVPVEQWYAWKTFLETPYVKASGGRAAIARGLAKTRLSALEAIPEVAVEKHWVAESQDILRREMQDRYVTTLKAVHQRYVELGRKAQGTRAGEMADLDAKRTGSLLEE